MRSVWSFAPKVNLAAPGPIGATTAGAGAFASLTASGTLAVTQGTTLTGGLNLGPQSGSLLLTTSGLTDYRASTSMSLGTEGPSVNYTPIAWFSFTDANFGPVYFPVWGNPP